LRFPFPQGAPHVILGMCHNKDEIKEAVEKKVRVRGGWLGG
jgi:hypothetical protein